MPENYVAESIRRQLPPPYTTYRLQNIPEHDCGYYEVADTFVTGLAKGSFKLYYALKSFPSLTDNRKYVLYFVTSHGLFVEECTHSQWDEPIDFRNITARFVHQFGLGDILINAPDSRALLPLYDVHYDEHIDGVCKPNSFDFNEHPELANLPHTLIIHSSEYDDIELPYDANLYDALRYNHCYLHLRADNYTPLEALRLWTPSY